MRKKDFVMKREDYSKNKVGQRQYLNHVKTNDLTRELYQHFESTVDIPRMKHGKRQTIETLINEEALLFAKFLGNERETWKFRIAKLCD